MERHETIVRDGLFFEDDWRRSNATLLDPRELDLYGYGLLERGIDIGLELTADAEIDPIARWLEHLAMISTRFEGFADGRRFTTARKLRRDLGFRGTLRASGPTIVDQYAFSVECGFDELAIPVEIARRQPERLWAEALIEIGFSYQRGAEGRTAVLRARHAA